jgi:hypothetical protein
VTIGVTGNGSNRVAFSAVLLALPVDDERRRITYFDAMGTRESRRPVADQKHVPAVFHDFQRQVDRMSHIADGTHAAGPQLRAFHHARVELDVALQIENRSDARVEKRLILELAHGGHRRNESTVTNERPACRERSFDRSLSQRALGHGRRPSAAMDDQSWACHLDLA